MNQIRFFRWKTCLFRMHRNLPYTIVVIYLVDTENEYLLIVGKEMDKHFVKLVGSDVVLFQIVVGYRSCNHICDTVEIVEERLHLVVRSEGAELELFTTKHVVLKIVEYRYNYIILARDNLVTVAEPSEYLY